MEGCVIHLGYCRGHALGVNYLSPSSLSGWIVELVITVGYQCTPSSRTLGFHLEEVSQVSPTQPPSVQKEIIIKVERGEEDNIFAGRPGQRAGPARHERIVT